VAGLPLLALSEPLLDCPRGRQDLPGWTDVKRGTGGAKPAPHGDQVGPDKAFEQPYRHAKASWASPGDQTPGLAKVSDRLDVGRQPDVGTDELPRVGERAGRDRAHIVDAD